MANNVQLSLSIEGGKVVSSTIDGVTTRIDGLGRASESAATSAGSLSSALGTIATAATVYAMVRMADNITTLNTQLNLSANSAAQAKTAYASLFAIAQSSRVSFTELGTTYAAIARSGNELGVSQSRLLAVTQSISQAMTIGGGSAQSMQAALIQLGQGLSSGTLRGEELNSIMEQTPRLAKAIADGLGVPIGELRKLGEAGALTGEQVINALEKSGPQLAREMASATMTVGQAFTTLQNSATAFMGDADKASGITATLAQAMQGVAGAIDTVGSAIKNNETTFGIIISGLAGASVAAGLALTALGISAVWAAVTLGGSVAVTAGIAAIGAIVGVAAYAGKELSHSEGVIKISLTQINNEIAAAEKSKNEILVAALQERKRNLEKELQDIRQKEIDSSTTGSVQSPDRILGRLDAKVFAKTKKEYEALASDMAGINKDFQTHLAQLAAAFEAGIIKTPEAYAKAVKELVQKEGGLKASKAALTDAQRLVIEGEKVYAALIAQSSGYSADYAKDTQALAASFAAKKLSVEELGKAMDLLNAKQPGAIAAAKELEAQTKAGVKAYEEYLKAQEKVLKGYQDSADSVEKQVQKLETEERATVIVAAQAISLAQAIAQVDLARLRELQTQELANGASGETLLALQREIAAREKMIGLIARKDGREAALDTEKKITEERKKGWEETDRLARGIFVDWEKDGSYAAQKIGDTLKSALLSAIYEATIRPIAFQIYNSVAGDGSAGVSGTGGLGAGGNILNQAAGASSIANAMNTGFAAFGAKVGSAFNSFAMSSTGTSLGLSSTSYAGNAVLAGGPEAVAAKSMTASAQSMSATASSMASIAAGALAGVAVGSQIGGDHKLQGLNSTEMAAIGAGIGGAVAGYFSLGIGITLGAAIGGAIGGIVDRAFGGTDAKLNEQGLRGTYSAKTGADAGGYYITQQSRGWFGGDGIEGTGKNGGYTKDAALTSYLNTGIFAVTTSVKEYAKVIGLSADAVDGFSKKIDVSIKDLSPEDAQKKIAESIGSFGDDMVSAVYGDMFKSVAKYDETNSTQTLTRLGKDLTAVNSVFDLLGYAALDASVLAANSATKIIDAFGGLDKYAQSMGSYYQNFYSAAEQRTNTAQGIADKLNLAGGSYTGDQIGALSRDAYRSIVDATKENLGADSPLYVALINASDAFAGIVPAAEAATDSMKKIMDQLDSDRTSLDAQLRTAKGLGVDTSGYSAEALGKFNTNEGIKKEIADLNQLNALKAESSTLAIALLRAQDKEEQAVAAERALAIVGMSELSIAQYDANAATRAAIDVLNKDAIATTARAEAAKQLGITNQAWQDKLDVLTGKRTQEQVSLANDLANATDDSTKALIREVYAQQAIKTAADTAATAATNLKSALATLVTTAAAAVATAEQNLQNARDGIRTAYDRELAALQSRYDVQKAKDAIRTAYDSEMARIKSDFDTQKTAANATKERFDTIGKQFADFANSLAGALDSPAQSFERLSAEYSRLSDMARLGDTNAASQAVGVGNALKDSILAKSGTRAEAERELAKLANSATTTAGVARTQVDIATSTLATLDAGLKVATDALANQVQGFVDVSTGVQSVGAAIAAYQATQASLDTGTATLNAQVSGFIDVTNAVNGVTAAIGAFHTSQNALDVDRNASLNVIETQTYFQKNTDVSAAYGKNTYGLSEQEYAQVHYALYGKDEGRADPTPVKQGKSYFELYPDVAAAFAQNNYGMDQLAYSARHYANYGINEGRTFPGFAVGTNFVPHDMVAQIHQGEMIVPKAFNPATAGIVQSNASAELIAEIRALRAQVAALQAESRRTAENTKKLSTQFDSATQGGQAMQTEAYV